MKLIHSTQPGCHPFLHQNPTRMCNTGKAGWTGRLNSQGVTGGLEGVVGGMHRSGGITAWASAHAPSLAAAAFARNSSGGRSGTSGSGRPALT